MFSNFPNYGYSQQQQQSPMQQSPFCPQHQHQPPQYGAQTQEVNVNKPYEIKGSDGSLKGYFWYYGNSVDLVFNVSGQITATQTETYLTINQILRDLNLRCSIYNFRHENVLEFSNSFEAQNKLIIEVNPNEWEAKGAVVTASLSQEMSQKLIKGSYYVELIASHPSGYCETLFDSSSCIFEVR